jgi:hypothetical protein
MSLAVPIALGMLGGLLGFLALRVFRLRWTWMGIVLPLAAFSWLLDRPLGLGLTVLALVGLAGGAYWHIEELERGGEEAARERELPGVMAKARGNLEHRKAREQRRFDDRLAIGLTSSGRVCSVPFVRPGHGVHALVLGATGSGKTFTQAAIAETYVLEGLPAIVIDPKSDGDLRRVLVEAAARAGARFREWSPSGDVIYNPYARGNPTEIVDKALAGQDWSEPHYELATQRHLGLVLSTLQAAEMWPPTISKIVRFMDPQRLDALASKVGGSTAERVAAYIDELTKREAEDLGGGRNRLAVLGEGALGPRIDPDIGKGELLDLRGCLERGEVIYFNLDSDRYPKASKLLAAALVIDLVSLTTDLRGSKLTGLVMIDEFAALASGQVARLFGRARDCGLSMALATQSLADLRVTDRHDSSDALTEQVITNISFAIVHRESEPDAAERLARMAGTQPEWATTARTQGRLIQSWNRSEGTRTRQRDFVVAPDQFKRLDPGQAVVVNTTEWPPAQVVRIWPPKAAIELGLGGLLASPRGARNRRIER